MARIRHMQEDFSSELHSPAPPTRGSAVPPLEEAPVHQKGRWRIANGWGEGYVSGQGDNAQFAGNVAQQKTYKTEAAAKVAKTKNKLQDCTVEQIV